MLPSCNPVFGWLCYIFDIKVEILRVETGLHALKQGIGYGGMFGMIN